MDTIIQSWDTAHKAGELNDYSVCTTWLSHPDGHFLVDVLRRRMTMPDIMSAMVAQAERWRPLAVLIEEKASGLDLIPMLERDQRWHWPLLRVVPTATKEMRAATEVCAVEGGRIWLPESSDSAPGPDWLPAFEAEVADFPFVDHDDQVDSMTQALKHFREHFGRCSVMDVLGAL